MSNRYQLIHSVQFKQVKDDNVIAMLVKHTCEFYVMLLMLSCYLALLLILIG